MDKYCKDTTGSYVDMDELVYRDNIHDNCIIVVMFFAIYKLFRYVDYYGNVDIFTRTIAHVSESLTKFRKSYNYYLTSILFLYLRVDLLC